MDFSDVGRGIRQSTGNNLEQDKFAIEINLFQRTLAELLGKCFFQPSIDLGGFIILLRIAPDKVIQSLFGDDIFFIPATISDLIR